MRQPTWVTGLKQRSGRQCCRISSIGFDMYGSRLKELISTGYSESSLEICHQLIVFEASEHGLLATWETPEELVCLSVSPTA
jgi:hypothetical protein